MNGTRVVGILGGMGPAAGADFARLFVQACTEEMQTPADTRDGPGLSRALAGPGTGARPQRGAGATGFGGHQPLEPMLQAMGKLAALGATSVAVACNTAHAWHGELQQRFPQLEVLHVAREVARTLARAGVTAIGLLATDGTYRSGLYAQALQQEGVQCHIPEASERERLMYGIYNGVKTGDLALAQLCFESVARSLALRHGLETLIMGCTEIPLALKTLRDMPQVNLVDPRNCWPVHWHGAPMRRHMRRSMPEQTHT